MVEGAGNDQEGVVTPAVDRAHQRTRGGRQRVGDLKVTVQIGADSMSRGMERPVPKRSRFVSLMRTTI